jgi:hypothetical protein
MHASMGPHSQVTYISLKASTTLPMQGIPCPANSLFPTAVYDTTLPNGAVQASGMTVVFLNYFSSNLHLGLPPKKNYLTFAMHQRAT